MTRTKQLSGNVLTIHIFIIYVYTCMAYHMYTEVCTMYVCYTCAHIPFTYKFSRDVIFEVFAVNCPSAKFSSLKFIGKTLAVMCVADQE